MFSYSRSQTRESRVVQRTVDNLIGRRNSVSQNIGFTIPINIRAIILRRTTSGTRTLTRHRRKPRSNSSPYGRSSTLEVLVEFRCITRRSSSGGGSGEGGTAGKGQGGSGLLGGRASALENGSVGERAGWDGLCDGVGFGFRDGDG